MNIPALRKKVEQGKEKYQGDINFLLSCNDLSALLDVVEAADKYISKAVTMPDNGRRLKELLSEALQKLERNRSE